MENAFVLRLFNGWMYKGEESWTSEKSEAAEYNELEAAQLSLLLTAKTGFFVHVIPSFKGAEKKKNTFAFPYSSQEWSLGVKRVG